MTRTLVDEVKVAWTLDEEVRVAWMLDEDVAETLVEVEMTRMIDEEKAA